MRDDLAMYLTLAPEFGGQRFGPYEGMEVRLGSNPERSNIVLPEAFGVARDHCRLMRSQDSGMVLAPTERTAAVWVWKGDARKPLQILTATAVRTGDSFALVSPDGPKFVVELASLPADVIASRKSSNKGIKGLTGDKLAQAGWSLLMARLYAFSPVSIAARAYYFVKSGAIFNPRILLTLILSGFTMATGFAGVAYGWFKSIQMEEKEEEVADLREQIDTLDQMKRTGIENLQTHQLLASAIGQKTLASGIEKDEALLTAVKQEASALRNDNETYGWLFNGDPRADIFKEWRTTLSKMDDLDEPTRVLLAYAAIDGTAGNHDFDQIKDSEGNPACGRGPLRLTARQGRQLGLTVQADYLTLSDELALLQDPAKRAEKLAPVVMRVPGATWPEPPPTTTLEDIIPGTSACAYVDGDDDRSSAAKLKAMVNTQFGKGGSSVPSSEGGYSSLARIAKLYAADIPGNNYATGSGLIKFTSGLSAALQESSDWPIKRTARVVARSAVLPCKAALSKDSSKLAEVFGKLPDPVTCLVLFYKLENG